MYKDVSLRVPLCLQHEDSTHCGAAASRMVARYYGLKRSLPRFVRELGITKTGGVPPFKLALWWLRQGYDVTIVGMPKQLPLTYMGLDSDVIRRKLDRLRKSTDPSCERLRAHVRDFLAAGGRLEMRPQTVVDITAALRRGEPPIMNLNTAVRNPYPYWDVGHYVIPVVVRKRGTEIVVNDPLPSRRRRTYRAEDLLFASYCWFGVLILVRPKS